MLIPNEIRSSFGISISGTKLELVEPLKLRRLTMLMVIDMMCERVYDIPTIMIWDGESDWRG